MAKELSQVELLDFLCQAGGRVANAVLLRHFNRFLRDPEAAPDELQRRREQFKSFVNSVATVRQEEGPGAAKFVVLKKRYRELVSEEPKLPGGAAEPPPPPVLPEVRRGRGASQGPAGSGGAPRAQGSACRGEPPRPQVAEERTCRGPARQLSSARAAREWLPTEPEGRSRPPALPRRPPDCPEVHREPCALLGAEKRSQPERGPPPPADPLVLRGGDSPVPFPAALPLGEMGVPPSAASSQQRIQEWLTRAHADDHRSSLAEPQPRAISPASSAHNSSCPSPSLDCRLPLPGLGDRRDQVPVFRSIRCQLSLQNLEDFVEQESSASEEGSSASGGSDSNRLEGGLSVQPGRQNRPSRSNEGPKERCPRPQANGQLVPLTKERVAQENGTVLEPPPLCIQRVGRLLPAEKPLDSVGQNREPPKPRKVAKMSSPSLVVPLSSQLDPWQGCSASAPDLERAGPDVDESTEHRSSVPLDPREHAWLVKVATGSWMQARALLLEDPHLATQKDFVSGYTVLHWLAKHGNAQVLQDVFTGAHKAGVALDVNVKSGCGYTPLHLAAMHGHQRVMQLLVQKLQCQVQVRDCSGKKPWQYLSSSTSGEVWQLLGAPRGKTIFPARPLARNSTIAETKGRSPELVRKLSRKVSCLKPQHIKWKMANRYPTLHESD